MKTAPPLPQLHVVSPLPRRDQRSDGLEQREAPVPEGRAWINGREVGGPDLRFAHLARSYD